MSSFLTLSSAFLLFCITYTFTNPTFYFIPLSTSFFFLSLFYPLFFTNIIFSLLSYIHFFCFSSYVFPYFSSFPFHCPCPCSFPFFYVSYTFPIFVSNSTSTVPHTFWRSVSEHPQCRMKPCLFKVSAI